MFQFLQAKSGKTLKAYAVGLAVFIFLVPNEAELRSTSNGEIKLMASAASMIFEGFFIETHIQSLEHLRSGQKS